MKLILLSDKRKIKGFIENDMPCPADIIIEYYLDCKSQHELPPEKVSAFVDTFLAGIITAHRRGFRPDYDGLLGFTYKNGRQRKSYRVNLQETLTIGDAVIESMQEGNTYEASISIVAQKQAMSEESVKKAYSRYKKIL